MQPLSDEYIGQIKAILHVPSVAIQFEEDKSFYAIYPDGDIPVANTPPQPPGYPIKPN